MKKEGIARPPCSRILALIVGSVTVVVSNRAIFGNVEVTRTNFSLSDSTSLAQSILPLDVTPSMHVRVNYISQNLQSDSKNS